MNLMELRAINRAKIKTLTRQDPFSPDLMRCQIAEQILADDDCFQKMSVSEIVEVLITVGMKRDEAELWAHQVKR